MASRPIPGVDKEILQFGVEVIWRVFVAEFVWQTGFQRVQVGVRRIVSGSAGAAAGGIVECLGFEETFAEQRIFIVRFRRLRALFLFVRESGGAGSSA